MLRREGWDALKLDFICPCTERVSDGENSGIKYADNISGIRLLHNLPVLGHHLLRLGQTDLAAALHMVYLHSGLELSGTDPHECNTVTVRFVHISLDFKYKGAEIIVKRIYNTGRRLSRKR